jgi:squalene-hopene/tetraprenyl-beta-curcumene cyclase
MTYAGLLSFIYAKVDRNDPRAKSAFDWATKHWTLDENPGMGSEGQYYFYNVLAKGLAAYGQDQFTLENKKQINWRAELARKLIGLQKIDPKNGAGYWVNPSGRWFEADPVLVTAYSLIALEIAAGQE